MKKYHFAILRNEVDDDHSYWEQACRERSDLLEWEVIDLTRSDWFERATSKKFDGFLAMPSSETNPMKKMYDERAFILSAEKGLPMYPSLLEIKLYENKKYLSYWLRAKELPHPKTWVFYYEWEALDFVKHCNLPVVAKTNIGASGRGVNILKSKEDLNKYIENTFSGKGAQRSIGPNLKKKGLLKRAANKLMHPKELIEKLKFYRQVRSDVQKDYVIFQEFIPHTYEWRCVRIGDSYFAHKKLVKEEKASGTLLKGYENPPLPLLDFVKEVSEAHHLDSLALDLFETADGRYLINELQCIFGQSDPYQMLVDGKPGRYRHLDGHWVFEPGDFNRFESFLLRVDHFLELLRTKKRELVV